MNPASEPFRERRANVRFPLAFDLQYRVAGQKEYRRGSTINLSSTGVLFRCAEPIPVNTEVTVVISWPVLLGGTCPLRLVMSGRAVWANTTECAIRVYGYEFRTAGKRVEIAYGVMQMAAGRLDHTTL